MKYLPVKKESPVPFIILAYPRTGTTLLHTYLNSHWNIHSYGDEIGMDIEGRLRHSGTTVREFVHDRLATSFPSFLKAAGLKFFYQYLKDDFGRKMLSEILVLENLRIIHLKRKDRLRTAISYELAIKTNAWSYSSREEAVVLEPDKVAERYNEIPVLEEMAEQLTRDHQVLTIYYEELVENPDKILKEVQVFLGVEPVKLFSILPRQHHEMKQYVVNYQNLTDPTSLQ